MDVPAFGLDIAGVGDVNGDDVDDSIIGTAYEYPYDISSKAASGYPVLPYWAEDEQANFLLAGDREQDVDISDLILVEGMSSKFQWNQRWLGDVNGDGYDDVVSCPWKGDGIPDPEQRLDIWYGSSQGLPEEPDDALRPVVSASNGPSSSCPLQDFAGVGDVNGDGNNDLMVVFGPKFKSYESYDPYKIWYKMTHEFAVYYGSENGFSDQPDWRKGHTTPDPTDGVGSVRMGHGDFDNNGYSDFVWSVRFDHYIQGGDHWEETEVYLLYGSEHGLVGDFSKPLVTYNDTVISDNLLTLDLNGDGFDDLYLKTRTNVSTVPNVSLDEHNLNILSGSQNGLSSLPHQKVHLCTIHTNWSVPEPPINITGDWFDCSALFLDVEKDRSDEVLLYTIQYDEQDQLSLRVGILEERGGLLSSNTSWEHWIPTTHLPVWEWGDWLGADTGDFDGDGLDDIAIGVCNFTAYRDMLEKNVERPAGQGHIYIFYGSGIAERMGAVHVVEGPRIFAMYKGYSIVACANRGNRMDYPREFRITLDPSGANITLGWNRTGEPEAFFELHDPEDHVDLVVGECESSLDEQNGSLVVRFNILFNWTWPHEDPCAVRVDVTFTDDYQRTSRTEDVFWVENDLELIGDAAVSGEWQHELSPGSWVRGGELLTVWGPIVVYEGTHDVYPPTNACDLKLSDDDGDSITEPMVSGQPANVSIRADPLTDRDEMLALTLAHLPGTARSASNLTFAIKVDAELPDFSNPVPDGRDWHSSRTVLVSITVTDNQTSGVDAPTLEYSYRVHGTDGFSEWNGEGLRTSGSGDPIYGLVFLELTDGDENHVRWRVKDRVGNGYAVSDELRIKVDTKNVTFSNPFPTKWQISVDIKCGVTVHDNFGSGISVDTIQYRVSFRNLSLYARWIDWEEGSTGDAQTINTHVEVEFQEIEWNYVQWRAMDIAGNGFTTSPHYQVRVDFTPPTFSNFHPPPTSKQPRRIVQVSIELDDLLSGVDTSSVRIRYGTNGTGSIGEWYPLEVESSSRHYTVRVSIELEYGWDNTVQFQAGDIAGNVAQSSEFHVWVNSPPRAVIKSPQNGTEMTAGTPILLDATESWDLDDDNLTYVWLIDSQRDLISMGVNGSIVLDAGSYEIFLIVRDSSNAEGRAQVSISVTEPVDPIIETGSNDLFLITLMVLILIIILTVIYFLRQQYIHH